MVATRLLPRVSKLAILLVFLAPAAHAIPPEISVSGRIEDATGSRSSIDGTFVGQIDFYGSEGGTAVLYTTTQNVTVTAGVFSTPITLPSDLLTLDSLYYKVSIDLDGNGIDANDAFVDRFKVSSVPYSLGTGPTPLFITAPVQQFPTLVAQQTNDIELVDFVTPPGGLRFSHISLNYLITGSPTNLTFSYGVYDTNGNAVAGPTTVTHSGPLPWTIDNAALTTETTLLPTTRYYAAFATNNINIKVPSAYGTSIPFGRGFVPDAAPNGVLPASFDPHMITFNADPTTGVYPSLALFSPPPPLP